MSKQAAKVSKLLSLVLRHKPEEIGIALDAQGWVEVGTLLEAMGRHGKGVTRAELEEVVATNDKRRFAFSEDGLRIRASQGHSVEVDLGLTPSVPPEVLLHRTATRFLEAIRVEGLRAMSRQHVHLHDDRATAEQVGRRHGKAALLEVRAGEMHRAGRLFYVSANGVWLTEAVPVAFIVFPVDH